MPSQINLSLKEGSRVEVIYNLAKARMEIALSKKIEEGLCIGIMEDKYNAVTFLAMHGDYNAVDFLICKYKGANLDDAVYGYAIGGFQALVEELLALGASLNYAIQGYAMRGLEEQVDDLLVRGASIDKALRGFAKSGAVNHVEELIRRGANPNYAIWGYAESGFKENVEDLIRRGSSLDYAVYGYAVSRFEKEVEDLIRRGASLQYAVTGYAKFGYTTKVNDLIARGATLDDAMYGYATGGHTEQVQALLDQGVPTEFAIYGYVFGGHLNKAEDLGAARNLKLYNDKNLSSHYNYNGFFSNSGTVLRLLSFTQDYKLRKYLAAAAKEKNHALDEQNLLMRANRINRIMNDYKLDYKQSQSLMIQGARIWILQGGELVKKNKLPADIFWYITSYVCGICTDDTRKIYDAVHANLLAKKLEYLHSGPSFFKRSQEIINESKQAYTSYQQRSSSESVQISI